MLGIGALILIAGQVWRPGESVPTTWPSATGSAVADEEAPPEEVTFGDAEEFTVSVPNGWQVEDSSGTSVLISRDGTSLFARSYLAGEDAVASDEARRMATRYASGVKRTGKASTTAEDGPGGLARGSYHSAGTVDGRQVQVYADVLIRPEDTQAVAVVTILRGDADADVAQQLAAMRDEVLGQL
ncbi:MAG: hypothetical protein HZY73_05915 [Micropruina sp.]|nr:MAG: hypothetical protein HZY73_05915 [Micropruina sp.]